jgi:hypothetical protein
MVAAAQRKKIVEIGSTAVSPPDHVMELAAVVVSGATRDRTGCVDTPEGSTLSPVGEAGRATEVEFAGGMEHDAISHHHRVDIGIACEIGEHPERHLDRNRPVDLRSGVGSVGIDHNDELGPARPGTRTCVNEQPSECQRLEMSLLLDRIGRTRVGRRFREQCFDGRIEPSSQLHAGDGIESTGEVPHSLDVDPRPQGGRPTLALESLHLVVGGDAASFITHPTAPLLGGGVFGDDDQLRAPVE